MIISAARPYFCPYPGYFARILSSDIFVILDEVQFPQGSTWITRNRFKNDQGVFWMSVPVLKKGRGLQKISEVEISGDERWRRKHLASLRQAYLHAPYHDDHLGIFERMLCLDHKNLVELNMELITYVLSELGGTTKLMRLSELSIRDRGAELIVGICRELEAARFLVQDSARKWLDGYMLEKAGITLELIKTSETVYPQLWGPFIADLSIFDLLFTCGPKARSMMGSPKTVPWELP